MVKHDTGTHFLDGDVQALLAHHGITVLVSPPYTPRYNGAREAGIGGLKVAALREATRQDRPEAWTCDDWAVAHDHRNATSLPRGLAGPTPDAAWAARRPITPAGRACFRAQVDQRAVECAAERGIMDWRVPRRSAASNP